MSMTRGDIESAMSECGRFLERAHKALEAIDRERESLIGGSVDSDWSGPCPSDSSYGSVETGALRRSSLDLTRALSEMRK